MARSNWTPIRGKVIVRKMYGITGSGKNLAASSKWKYIVEYSTDGGEPTRSEIKQASGLIAKKMINPFEGMAVPLLFNQRNHKVRFDWKDPSINLKASWAADKSKEKDRYKKELKG